MERERVRSERTNDIFSIVFLNISRTRLSVQEIAEKIRGKIYCYADIGLLDKKTMGILLPYSSRKDASMFAHEIAGALRGEASGVRHHVLTYPRDWLNPVHDENEKLLIKLHVSNKIPPWKRLIDITASGAGLLMLLPVFIILAAYIKAVSPGAVFFRQKRVGFLGKQFTCYKFRTMHENSGTTVHNNYFNTLISQEAPMLKLDAHDSRIIPFGAMLRKMGLDELPQIFNVLKGDMSIIGPRPCIPYEAEAYKLWQRRRFEVAPGITGLWQVSGKNRTTFNQMMRYDIRYALKRNFFLDIKILLKTIPAIIDQVYEKRSLDLTKVLGEKV